MERHLPDHRLKKDVLVPAMVRWERKYSDQLLETVDWCLCLNHLYRPQSVFVLQKALNEPVPPPAEPVKAPSLGRSLSDFVGRMRKKAVTP